MIRLIHVSDLHFGRKFDRATQNGSDLLDRIFKQYDFANAKDTYLLASGDFVDGEDILNVKEQWIDARQAFNKFQGKLYVCGGNHDQAWETGELDAYREFCKALDLSRACAVPTQLTDGDTTINMLGLDSTWWSPILGITGIGKIDERELNAARAFAARDYVGWKLLYLHHRPVEPSLYAEIQLAASHLFGEERKANFRKLFLALRGAKDLCKALAGKVDVMCFGHDKSFATDFDEHEWPYWINANREDTREVGWLELSFEPKSCNVQVFGTDGAPQALKTIRKG